MSTHDVVVVGGGPAGAAFAAELALGGRDVAIVEREAEPKHKVCGEFLSREALAAVERLGVDLRALGAVPVRRVAVSRRGWRIERPLPFSAMSLSRKALDEALLRRAEAAGARVLRGLSALELTREGGGWRLRLPDREVIARDAVLATGKHDLRGRPRPPGRQDDLVGFKMHFRLAPEARLRLSGVVEIGLFPGGYAGLEAVEDQTANLCFLIRQSVLRACGGDWESALARLRAGSASLDEALEGAEPLLDRPLAVARVPYGLVRRTTDGPWLLGDQAAVIPSFAGEGLALALHSARLAARHMLNGRPADDYQSAFARAARRPMRIAVALSRRLVDPRSQALAPLLAPLFVTTLAGATRLAPEDEAEWRADVSSADMSRRATTA